MYVEHLATGNIISLIPSEVSKQMLATGKPSSQDIHHMGVSLAFHSHETYQSFVILIPSCLCMQ